MSDKIKFQKTPETWKQFEATELTHSSFHHLWAIYELLNTQGYARSSDVARLLNISRGSASITLKKLREKGYVEEDRNKFFRLTETSTKLINTTLINRRAFNKFFRDVLGIDEKIALEDACKIEHLVSRDTAAALIKFLEFFSKDNSEAEKFTSKLKDYVVKCTMNCEICESECIFEEDKKRE